MEHLHDKLGRLMWLLKKQQLKTHMRRGPLGDASRGQGRILAFLQIKDGLSTKELSYMLDIRVSSLNEMLAKLEKGGFIMAHWDGTSETEERIKEETRATIRCIPFDTPEENGKCILTGKPSNRRVLFARAY